MLGILRGLGEVPWRAGAVACPGGSLAPAPADFVVQDLLGDRRRLVFSRGFRLKAARRPLVGRWKVPLEDALLEDVSRESVLLEDAPLEDAPPEDAPPEDAPPEDAPL